jgi:hypothetical protein
MEISARSAEQKDGFHDDLTALKLPCIFPCPMDLRLCRKSPAGVTSTALFGRIVSSSGTPSDIEPD